MIYTPSLQEAREQAAILTAHGYIVYIYQLESGDYWLTLTPKIDATFVEKLSKQAVQRWTSFANQFRQMRQ